jgi:16S rRNA (uracil1498-N3)-methyltransferase
MRIPRIYVDQLIELNGVCQLNESASHYVSKVLRMSLGRELIVFNGQGGEYLAEISKLDKKSVEISIKTFSSENRESDLSIELAIGISRGERMDWVLQKATELGVTSITPLLTERTEVKVSGDRQDKKMQHWQQIIISSCEQCQRNVLPRINEPQLINNWLGSVSADKKFVLHHRHDQPLQSLQKPQSICLLIGPEGGLSDSEIQLAEKNGFQSLRLGPRVLRTETAPIAAISLVQYLWGDLG